MREIVSLEKLHVFLRALGTEADRETVLYLTGGATALIYGWRASTVDVDLKIEPDSDRLLRAIPRLKETLRINVELASPDDFIPPLPGWKERSPFVLREGLLTVRHYDLNAQALSKLERAHERDLKDVQAMLERGLVTKERLRELFLAIEPHLYRYPAISPPTFRRSVEEALDSGPPQNGPGMEQRHG